ncbi:hypothetical protein Tco_0221557 [Tanacetum coccineum]
MGTITQRHVPRTSHYSKNILYAPFASVKPKQFESGVGTSIDIWRVGIGEGVLVSYGCIGVLHARAHRVTVLLGFRHCGVSLLGWQCYPLWATKRLRFLWSPIIQIALVAWALYACIEVAVGSCDRMSHIIKMPWKMKDEGVDCSHAGG